MKTFSPFWKSSKSRRKQRKYRFMAPLHIRQSFVSSHLSKELRSKYHKRSLQVRVGDKVKILRGQFRKKTATVERVDLKKTKVYLTGVDVFKRDGSKSLYPLDPSNLQIMELQLEDKQRKKILDRKTKGTPKILAHNEQKKELKKEPKKESVPASAKESNKTTVKELKKGKPSNNMKE